MRSCETRQMAPFWSEMPPVSWRASTRSPSGKATVLLLGSLSAVLTDCLPHPFEQHLNQLNSTIMKKKKDNE